MIRLTIATILFYAACAPAVENYRLREELRIAESINAMMVPVKQKPVVKLRKL